MWVSMSKSLGLPAAGTVCIQQFCPTLAYMTLSCLMRNQDNTCNTIHSQVPNRKHVLLLYGHGWNGVTIVIHVTPMDDERGHWTVFSQLKKGHQINKIQYHFNAFIFRTRNPKWLCTHKQRRDAATKRNTHKKEPQSHVVPVFYWSRHRLEKRNKNNRFSSRRWLTCGV